MMCFFDYPKSAKFGRVVSKSKIYEHVGAKAALKELFVREVDQIVWQYKLAPETVNLSATKAVTEIQVFNISLKTGKLDEDVLRAIDKAIPFPIIFELVYDCRFKVIAAFKRLSEADADKWVISEYFSSDWSTLELGRVQLPIALNIGRLYDKILTALMPKHETSINGQSGESVRVRVGRLEAISAYALEVKRIKARLTREKQFNKRVVINADLREVELKLEKLTGETQFSKAE
jgi:hypothetical protein